MKTLEGSLVAKPGLRFCLVAARFNDVVVQPLIGGAQDALHRHGVDNDDIETAWAPGAFELPLVARKMAASGRYDAIICLGAVIRGDTPHFDYVCAENAKGIAAVNRDYDIPAIYGVVTTDTLEQAIERAGTKAGNKGWDAALAAIEMARLLQQLPQPSAQ